jgi:hypothetical protein
MNATLSCDPVTSVAEAVTQMTAIDRALPPTDGVSAFNRMYLAVTTSVDEAISNGFFTDSAFLKRLDVVFANHYFAALRRAQVGRDVPQCWGVLWQRRAAIRVAPLQFAFAGMNAHINHDLVLALVETLDELAMSPDDPAVHRDFTRVNELLAALDGQIRRSFEQGLLLRLEQRWGQLEDRVDGWSIAAARAAAWHDACMLWRVRHHEHLRSRYERILDDAVALAGRCLLAPLGHSPEHHGSACATHEPVLVGIVSNA